MGRQPATATEPGAFSREVIGHFILRGQAPQEGHAAPQVRDLYPFLGYLPDPEQARRLHFYDSLYQYKVRKEVGALDYDNGFKQISAEPIPGLEKAFTADLLAAAFGRHRGR